MRFLIVNGVNLGLTGLREKEIYGTETLDSVNGKIKEFCENNGDEAEFYQSDVEGELCRAIHGAYLNKTADAIVINAGAYSHYSIAIRDAISAVELPVAEVHLSNICAREDFRAKSVLAEVCQGSVFGFGYGSYISAIVGLKTKLKQ